MMRGIFSKKSASKGKVSKGKGASCDGSITTSKSESSVASDEFILTKGKPVPHDAPHELKILREFIKYKDMHDTEKMAELTHQHCCFNFIDSEAEMPAYEFFASMKDIFASFPDLHFFWKTMKVREISSEGTILIIEDYYGTGKHTGDPYFFGPYEPVPKTGITVKDEPIEFTFTIKDGKITSATIDAFGQMVGPPGFYSKIGGLII